MTRTSDILKIRELLQQRRRDLTETSIAQQREVTALKDQERDPEYEESAQVELADYTLSHLLETQRRELMLIDAALQRIDSASFGECLDCGQPIAIERLEAVPFALRCEEDAESREHELRMMGGARAVPTL